MKKSLVLAMAMALGVTASAYAANPFSDVPAGHWAYDSVAELAAAGVVDGYADGSFGGDKLMTRYEMAQIVAKAMAKGANVDKLAAEFADELDTLGVRVANLEKKADNVKITGQVRYHYADYDGYADHANALRTRLWVNGQINDDWSYTGMVQNVQKLDNNSGDEDVVFQRAYVNGRVGGLDVVAGRQNITLVDGNLYDTRFDGVVASYGKDVKVTGFYGKPTDQNNKLLAWDTYNTRTIDFDNMWGAKVDAKIGVVKATAGYTVFGDATTTKTDTNPVTHPNGPDVKTKAIDDNKVWNVGIAFDLAKELKFTADYLKATDYSDDGFSKIADMGDDGYVLGLSFKGAKASEVGTWGLYGKYYDQDRPTVVAHTMNGEYGSLGFDGYMVGANYTVAKNMVAAVEYYDLERKEVGNDQMHAEDMKTLWTQLVFSF